MISNHLSNLIFFLLPLGSYISFKSGSVYSLSLFLVLSLFMIRCTTYFFLSFGFFLSISFVAIFLSYDQFVTIPWSRILFTCLCIAPFLSSILLRKPLASVLSARSLLRSYKFVRAASFITAFVAIAYSLIFQSRPSLLFDEPTRLGLYFVSVFCAYLYIRITPVVDNLIFHNKPTVFEIIVILCASISTLTTHLVLLLPVFLTLLTPRLYRAVINLRFKKSLLILITVSISLMGASLAAYISLSSGISHRLLSVLNGASSTNLSSLSWLRGLSYLIHTYNESPFLGFGLGSFGYVTNNSILSQSIDQQFRLLLSSPLNTSDGYSLFFRLGHDIGLLILPALVFSAIFKFSTSIVYRSSAPLTYSLDHSIDRAEYRTAMVFYKVLGLTLFYGSLLKEPILTSFPFVYVPFLLAL